jgi:hypothetical protein
MNSIDTTSNSILEGKISKGLQYMTEEERGSLIQDYK